MNYHFISFLVAQFVMNTLSHDSNMLT